MDCDRRTVIKAGLGLGASLLLRPAEALAQMQPLLQKKIPSSGESIPIIGLGTARRYEEIKNDTEKAPLRETIRQFQTLGAKVIDSRHPTARRRRWSANWSTVSRFAI